MFSCKFIFVIPCYNEEERFDEKYFNNILSLKSVGLLFVNDGSEDRTKDILQSFVEKSPLKSELLNLPKNCGKAEAVRRGILRGFDFKSTYVGFLDADGAFPVEVVRESLEKIEGANSSITSFWFSRVKLAGSQVERDWKRHYIGRVIATWATTGLTNCPYDTQAGFKVFVSEEITRDLWEKPFKTRWLFDVEIFFRLIGLKQDKNVLEIPVKIWKDVKGSKIKFSNSHRVLVDLIIIQGLRRRIYQYCNTEKF